MRISEERIRLIPNMVVAPRAERSRETWRRELHIGPDAFVVLMAASLSRFKDHDILLDAWSRFQNMQPDARLLLAGKDLDQKSRIEKRISSLGSVLMLGEVEDIGGLYLAADLLVHSSRREGTPNAVLEAMATGLPVIATDIPGTRLALGTDASWLTEPGDASDLYEALGQAAADASKRKEIGRRNRARARKLFSPERILPMWEELIQNLLQGPSPMPACIPRRIAAR